MKLIETKVEWWLPGEGGGKVVWVLKLKAPCPGNPLSLKRGRLLTLLKWLYHILLWLFPTSSKWITVHWAEALLSTFSTRFSVISPTILWCQFCFIETNILYGSWMKQYWDKACFLVFVLKQNRAVTRQDNWAPCSRRHLLWAVGCRPIFFSRLNAYSLIFTSRPSPHCSPIKKYYIIKSASSPRVFPELLYDHSAQDSVTIIPQLFHPRHYGDCQGGHCLITLSLINLPDVCFEKLTATVISLVLEVRHLKLRELVSFLMSTEHLLFWGPTMCQTWCWIPYMVVSFDCDNNSGNTISRC